MYMRNVRLDHWTIFIMVVSHAPCSFRYTIPPNLREWTPTRFGLILAWRSFRAETENPMPVMIYVGVTMEKGSLHVTLYSQIYNSVLPPLARMW